LITCALAGTCTFAPPPTAVILPPLITTVPFGMSAPLTVTTVPPRIAKVPCGPINDLADVFADPQVQQRGMTVQMPHPAAGSVKLVASPMKFSATPVQYRRAPPLLGEHTTELLREFGLLDADIAALRDAQAI